MIKKSLIILGVSLVAFSLSAEEKRKTLIGDSKKLNVSQKEAESLLKELKAQGDKDIFKMRPSVDKIAKANGGASAIQDEPDSEKAKACWADEGQFFSEIQNGLLNPWTDSWGSKNVTAFNKLLSNAKISKLATQLKGKPQKIGQINYYKNWSGLGGDSNVGAYLAQFKKIEGFELTTLKYTARQDYRNENLDMKKADLHMLFDLRGITNDGQRRNDRGPIKVTVVKSGEDWKITEISDWGLETVVTSKASFEDITNKSGITAIPEYRRLEAIRRGGYALAVGDVNNDGHQDMYVGSYGPGKLLFGQKDGNLVEAKSTGLSEKDTLVKSAVFADFDNDSKADILLTRFVPTAGVGRYNYTSDIIIYKNEGAGKFKKMETIIPERTPADTAMPAAVGDFNGDGLMDFYVGFPGHKDFTIVGKIPNREGIRAQGLYMNKGNFKFSENNVEDYNKEKYDKVTEAQRIYPHSSVALDFDQDGDVDIVVIDDRGNISPAYQNDGKGKFIQAQQYIGVKTQGYGMGMAAADIDNNGVLDMVYTNVNFTNQYRLETSCKSNWNHGIFGTTDHGLKFYYGMRKGQFADATMKNGLFYAGEGLAGVEFLDYNNDGYQDLYVANGLWTGTDKNQDLSNYFMRSAYVDQEHVIMEAKSETQSSVMKILAGFVGDVFTENKLFNKIMGIKSNVKERPHLAGFQRNRLFRNLGNGEFIEIGYLENVDSLADGYVIAKADLDGDGALELILRNGDPGTAEINFPAVQIFKNQNKENHKSVRLKLLAANSGFDAIGAEVKVQTSEGTQYQQLVGNNGAVQSELIMHFGLGSDKTAKKIVITWPSKKTTTLENIPAGYHVVREESGGIAKND